VHQTLLWEYKFIHYKNTPIETNAEYKLNYTTLFVQTEERECKMALDDDEMMITTRPYLTRNAERTPTIVRQPFIYRVVQKTDTQFYFWDNFSNSAPILTILSLLQAEIYGA